MMSSTSGQNSSTVNNYNGNKVTSGIFDVFDPIWDMIQDLKLECPQIIAIGDRGVGKSTVLNRSFGHAILPTGRDLRTLCAIRIQFRRGNQFLCKIQVCSGEKLISTDEVSYEKFNTIHEKLQHLMKEMSPNGHIVKDKEIVVCIFDQNNPCIDYLDLPGLVCTAGNDGNGKPSGKVEDTISLIRDVYEKEYRKSIILLVIRAQNNAMSNSKAAGLLKDLDDSFMERTVGALTKVDLFQSEDNEEQADILNLLSGEVYQLLHYDNVMPLCNGWVGLGSNCNSEVGLRHHQTLQSMEDEEKEFFCNHQAYKGFWESGNMGISNLRTKLVKAFETMIAKHWCPLIEEKARQLFKEKEMMNCCLGMPFCSLPQYTEYVKEIKNLAEKHCVKCHSLVISDSSSEILKFVLLERAEGVKLPGILHLCPDVEAIHNGVLKLQREINKSNEYLNQPEFFEKQKEAIEGLVALLRKLQKALTESVDYAISRYFIDELIGEHGNSDEFPLQVDKIQSDGGIFLSTLKDLFPGAKSTILKLKRFEDGLLKGWKESFSKSLEDASHKFKSVSDETIQMMSLTKCIYNDGCFQLKAVMSDESIDHTLIRHWVDIVTPAAENAFAYFDQIDVSSVSESCVKEREAILKSMVDILKVIEGIHKLQDGLGIVRGMNWAYSMGLKNAIWDQINIGNDVEIDDETYWIMNLDETQSDLIDFFNSVGKFYKSKKKNEKSIACFKKARDLVGRIQQSAKVATVTDKKAVHIRTHKLGEEPVQAAAWRENDGVRLNNEGQHDEALKFFQDDLKNTMKKYDEKHLAVAASYNNVGAAYYYQRDYKKALEHINKALQIKTNLLGDDDLKVAALYKNLGCIYRELGEHEEAHKYHKMALNIRKKESSNSPVAVADSYNNIGLVLAKKGEYKEALECYQQASKLMNESVHGPVAIAASCINTGLVYCEVGEFTEALRHHIKAIKRIDGIDQLDVAAYFNSCAYVYYQDKQYRQAFCYYRDALEILLTKLSLDHIDVITCSTNIRDVAEKYYDLGDGYNDMKRCHIAVDFYEKAVEVFEFLEKKGLGVRKLEEAKKTEGKGENGRVIMTTCRTPVYLRASLLRN